MLLKIPGFEQKANNIYYVYYVEETWTLSMFCCFFLKYEAKNFLTFLAKIITSRVQFEAQWWPIRKTLIIETNKTFRFVIYLLFNLFKPDSVSRQFTQTSSAGKTTLLLVDMKFSDKLLS